jgi:hypothetical protein
MLLISSLCWFSCGTGPQTEEISTGDSLSGMNDTGGQAPAIEFDSATVKKGIRPDKAITPYRGKLLQAWTWEDANGSNTMIFSEKEAYYINKREGISRAEFYVCCHAGKDSEVKKLWEITDLVDSCICDCQVSLMEETIEVKDLDGDGVAENLFIYLLNDRCDASPVSTKLMMHSGEHKMAIRGVSQQFLGPSEAESNRFRKELGLEPVKYKVVDEIFAQYPEVFRSYASKFWDDYIKSENEKFRIEMGY